MNMPATLTAPDLARLGQQLFDAMIGGDAKTLDTLLSNDLRYIHSNGRMQSKPEVLKDCETKGAQKRKVEFSETVTTCYPGVGVVSTIVRTITNPGSSETSARARISYVWVEESQGWRLMLRHPCKMPD
jgi:hypothetical protein